MRSSSGAGGLEILHRSSCSGDAPSCQRPVAPYDHQGVGNKGNDNNNVDNDNDNNDNNNVDNDNNNDNQIHIYIYIYI